MSNENLGKTIEQKVLEFKEYFRDWTEKEPDGYQIKNELLDMIGINEDELCDQEMSSDMTLIKVPTDELLGFGTYCGRRGNKAFSSEAIDFLRTRGIEFIVGIGETKELIISSLAINISTDDAERFSTIIDRGGGSLRVEKSRVDGWSVLESE